ncbi:hypothetical protein ACFLZ8_05040, partial [Planctomycetota bacterium]
PALNSARELGKRSVCLGNLKSLQLGWSMYADSNDEKIIRGEVYDSGPDGTGSSDYWMGDDMAAGDLFDIQLLPEELQVAGIRAGALFSYVKNEEAYRCPHAYREAMRTYSIVDSMRGMARQGTSTGSGSSRRGVKVGNTTLWITNRMEITSPAPDSRIVFLDTGKPQDDSFATHYVNEQWWDPISSRHGDGTTFSFADGHGEYWKWIGAKTLSNSKIFPPTSAQHNLQPESQEDYKDLYRFQRAVWGRLGYTPTHQL